MRLCAHPINFQEERLMLKKLFATLAIAAVPFTASQADNSMPSVLAGLDSSVQVMDEQQLNEVRGTGPLPSDFTYTEFEYVWNFYGAKSDYRSYIYKGGGTWTGGKRISSGSDIALIGEAYLVTYDGQNAPRSTYQTIEEHTLYGFYDEPNNTVYYGWNENFRSWNRPWNGTFSIGVGRMSAL